MLVNALTVERIKTEAAGKFADGQGLWLVKRDRARGKWVLRVVIAGKRHEKGLGRWPDVSLLEARQRAADVRKLVREGADVIPAKHSSRLTQTVTDTVFTSPRRARSAQVAPSREGVYDWLCSLDDTTTMVLDHSPSSTHLLLLGI